MDMEGSFDVFMSFKEGPTATEGLVVEFHTSMIFSTYYLGGGREKGVHSDGVVPGVGWEALKDASFTKWSGPKLSHDISYRHLGQYVEIIDDPLSNPFWVGDGRDLVL